ncbi:ABC transporter substrate-binding protein [Azospirillum halopraeferens]|uniref:ABC transporter substrate-binding protein n=1 Tax=Azospirillum halopraeferens TaxID=34010 RepID=UPI000423FEC7|nr:ABC transporter substrate-binding protein [Azospirillum halopraeferens]
MAGWNGGVRAAVLVAAWAAAALTAALPGAAAAEARRDLVVGMQLEPPHLDPTAGAAGAIDEVVYANLFEPLLRIDSDGGLVYALAEEWGVSDDGLSYTFRLRPGARFHDGTAADSADVKFSLDRARAADSVNAQKGYFATIDRVETPDPLTVVVHLTRPDGLFLFHMAQGDAVIVAPESAATNKQKPVGTGPFRFARWVAGDRVELERNPDYDGPAPALDRVTFRFIADPAAQVASLMAGDVDTFPQFNTFEALDRFRNDQRFRVKTGSGEGETLMAINNARPPFDDVRVRRALAHAIDRAAVIEAVTAGIAPPIGSHFAPHRAGYVDLTGLYPYDPDRARALLAEAGHPGGFSATLKLPPPIYARRSGELIAAMLADVGVRVSVENTEWAPWLERVFRAGDYDLTVIAHTEPLDIDIYGRPDYYFGYRSARFDALMAELETTRDEGHRNALYGDAQRVIAEDAVNAFLFQLPIVTVEKAGLEGTWQNRPLQANDITGVRWRN